LSPMPRSVHFRRKAGARILRSKMYCSMSPRWLYDLCRRWVWTHLYLIRCDHCNAWDGSYKEAVGDEFWCAQCRTTETA
jgi:hypothetical protein